MLTAIFTWFSSLFFWSAEPAYLTDTADTGDTANQQDTGDSGQQTETGDTSTPDDTADTADSLVALKSAMELAGENGGFGCSTVDANSVFLFLTALAAVRTRRR
jgi:hypothetical protein